MKKRSVLKLFVATALVGASMVFADGAAVKGNKSSKIYHKPACKHYAAKGSTEAFNSETEAQKAGYKICKQCDKPKAKPRKK